MNYASGRKVRWRNGLDYEVGRGVKNWVPPKYNYGLWRLTFI